VLAHDPPVIILDEPTVGVDPQSRNLIFESIERLKSEGRTIIYTTHYMEEAQRLCDRVAIIDHGKILALDTVEKLIQTYGGVSVVDVELDEIPADIKTLPGTLEGKRLRVESERPMEVLTALSAARVNFTDLKIERPNLEKVFLNLTGRRLRD
jgi:ABC-2 type transport system ATP-binding protein